MNLLKTIIILFNFLHKYIFLSIRTGTDKQYYRSVEVSNFMKIFFSTKHNMLIKNILFDFA
jgi:hypothetical protein